MVLQFRASYEELIPEFEMPSGSAGQIPALFFCQYRYKYWFCDGSA
jgi:hypothetical protein